MLLFVKRKIYRSIFCMYKEIQKEYALRTSDFTPEKTLKKSAILDLFQDIAGYHSNFLGCGVDDFSKKGYGWILVGVRCEALKAVNMYDNLTVKTWPIKPSFAKYQREYLAVNAENEVVLKGDAVWTIIDLNTRKPAVLKDVYQGIDCFKSETAFTDKFVKTRPSDDTVFSFTGSRTVNFSDIDMNGHVNNIKYADFIVDVLGSKIENYRGFHIDYHKEALSGDTIDIYKGEDKGKLIVKGVKDGEISFIAEYRN